MTTIENEIDLSDFNEQIVAIEILFNRLHPNRFYHLAQVIEDNINYTDLIEANWSYGIDEGGMWIKADHPPIACNIMEMEPMLKDIKRDMNRMIKVYNKLCGTDIEYDSFKLHFLDPELASDFD